MLTTARRKHILIGGKGFLGSAFADFLTRNQFEVASIYKGDLPGNGDEHVATSPVIVDFAYTSLPNTTADDPIKDFSGNLSNVICHLDYARTFQDATYVYISSGGTVYGNSKPSPIDELHGNVPLSPYGITKLACEKFVLMYKEVYGLDVRIVRPSNIYGPGQRPYRGQGLVATALAMVLQNKPFHVFGDGSAVRDYLYIDDFCKLLMEIITLGKNGEIYNMGSGVGLSINEVLSEIIKLNEGRSGGISYLPSRLFDVHYNVLDCRKASGLNNWRPDVDMKSGFANTMNWMRKHLDSSLS